MNYGYLLAAAPVAIMLSQRSYNMLGKVLCTVLRQVLHTTRLQKVVGDLNPCHCKW